MTVSPERISLPEFLDTLGITREQLIQIGILIGTDFNEGIHGIGPKKALKIVGDGRFSEVMAEKAPGTDPEPIMEFFLSPPAAEIYHPEWKSPDPDSVKLILCDEYGFSSERIRPVLERIAGPQKGESGQMRLDAWN